MSVSAAEARRMAAALPEARDASSSQRLVFEIGGKGFAWTFMRRVDPKKARVPDLGVLAVRCPFERKELLIEAAPEMYFDDAHYRGYPAVLVNLKAIGKRELRALLADACALQTARQTKPRKAAAKKRTQAKPVKKTRGKA